MLSLQQQLQEGWRLHRNGEFSRAAEAYAAVLRADPDNVDALHLLGFLYGQNRAFDLAEMYLGRAIKRHPGSPDMFLLRGFALKELGRYEEALVCFDEALALKPDFRTVRLDRAACLFRLRRYEDAAADYDRLLALDPEFPFARGNALFSRLHCCDWSGLEKELAAIRASLAAGQRVIAPFDGKAVGLNPAEELRCAQIWVADQCPPTEPLWRGECYRHQRIRLAYVSADFHSHAMATLMAGVFEHHDRRQFETIAISLGPDDGSPMRRRLMQAFDRVIDVRGKSESDIAGVMRQLETDVAVDLMGFTEGCRPGIFARKGAPVQVNFLGYPGTMGAPYIDYLIADCTVAPEMLHNTYTEKLVTLPHTFMPADATREISARTFNRAELGLPESVFVFSCFNASYKITPQIFDVWMRLLKEVPDSILWLGQINAAAQCNLRREAQSRGVVPERLIFATYMDSPADHLARLKAADLFLDTAPYNAHATAMDALWAGVPVLTCIGQGFAGRVAASLLYAIGLPELIAESLASYEETALSLARQPETLARLRTRLSNNRLTEPLFNTARFTRNLEAAYLTMSERQQQGLQPVSFAVADQAIAQS